MRKTIISILCLLYGFSMCAQCLEERSAFESYYQKNLSGLDPIEGFWSVTVNSKLYLNGELINDFSKSQAAEWAIIKDGESFHACHKYGGYKYDYEIYFYTNFKSYHLFI